MKNKFIYTLLLLSLTLHADKVAFSFYNDFFAGSDKDFTNGVSIYWLDESKDNTGYTDFILNITDKLYFALKIPLATCSKSWSSLEVPLTPFINSGISSLLRPKCSTAFSK